MAYITMGEAEKIVPVARSTFRKHAKSGKLSTSTNARGLQIVDIAELDRFYDGKLKPMPNGNGQAETQEGNGSGQHETANIDGNGQVEILETDKAGHLETPTDSSEVVELLREQLADTKAELADAKSRERQLLSMLSTEQEKTKLLMLAPPPGEPEPEKKKKPSIFGYFRIRK